MTDAATDIKRSILRLFCAGCLLLLGVATVAGDPSHSRNILSYGLVIVGFLWAPSSCSSCRHCC